MISHFVLLNLKSGRFHNDYTTAEHALIGALDPYLVFTLAKELFFAQVVDSQQFSNSHQDSSLKWSNGQRHILYWGLPRKKTISRKKKLNTAKQTVFKLFF